LYVHLQLGNKYIQFASNLACLFLEANIELRIELKKNCPQFDKHKRTTPRPELCQIGDYRKAAHNPEKLSLM